MCSLEGLIFLPDAVNSFQWLVCRPLAGKTGGPTAAYALLLVEKEPTGIKSMQTLSSIITMAVLEKLRLPAYRRRYVIVLLVFLGLSGCAFLKVNKEHAEGLYSTVLVGRVTSGLQGKGPIIVAAYSMKGDKREVVHYTVLHDSGEYELMVAKGSYYLFAYRDQNSNLIYDPGEPAGQYGDPKLVVAPAGGVVGGLDIEIPKTPHNIAVPAGFAISPEKPARLHSRLAGAIIDLDDERFSAEQGVKGYWESVTFYRELGGNIYFLEEYDPDKIPILFIHGATGTPKAWKFFVENIDRTRFQPWFYYYPSGTRIQSMSYLLLWKLENLRIKYNFEQLYITAHSMGGLVARSFIMDHGGRFPYVKLFVSLATPWGGAEMAEYGVKQSPAVVPCWLDMQPESPFIQSLYAAKMPELSASTCFTGIGGTAILFDPTTIIVFPLPVSWIAGRRPRRK